jgi:hypothetical protein
VTQKTAYMGGVGSNPFPRKIHEQEEVGAPSVSWPAPWYLRFETLPLDPAGLMSHVRFH